MCRWPIVYAIQLPLNTGPVKTILQPSRAFNLGIRGLKASHESRTAIGAIPIIDPLIAEWSRGVASNAAVTRQTQRDRIFLRPTLRESKLSLCYPSLGNSLLASAHPYRLTDKGTKVALIFVLFHKQLCGPMANSLFSSSARPSFTSKKQFGDDSYSKEELVAEIGSWLAALQTGIRITRSKTSRMSLPGSKR